MSQPKVSVIIPVYNTASYLREAIGSIMQQTLTEIEILVVNDGSTDGSEEIIRELALQDGRIRFFEQENKGLSEARNTGLRHVTGKYIYFMDSDDYLEADCFDCCYSRCENQKLDFVFFDAENRVSSGVVGNLQNYQREGLLDDTRIYKGVDLFDEMLDKFIYRSPVWLSFVQADFLRTWFTGFYPGIIHEDHLFTVLLYLHAKRCCYVSQTFFKRRVRVDSIMNKTFSIRNIKGYIVTTDELSSFADRHPEMSSLLFKYLEQMLNAVTWESHKLIFKDKVFFCKWLIRYGYTHYIHWKIFFILFLKK